MKILRFSNIDVSSTAFRETIDSIIIYLLSIRSWWSPPNRSARVLASSCASLFTHKLRHYYVCFVCTRIESLSSRGFTRGRDRYVYLCLPSRRWTTLTCVEGKSSPTSQPLYLFPLSFSATSFSFFHPLF